MFALCAERSKEPVEKSRYYVWEFIMKKNILRIMLPVLTMYAAAALEMTVPEFHFGVLVAKQPNEKQFSIVQESAINFRLLQGERFYSDLNLSLHIPDIIRFFHPQQYARSIGQFAFADFSLNFPRIGGRFLSLSLFTGRHRSLTGVQYGSDFLKYGMRPVRMYDSDVSAAFLPTDARESLGVSFAGMVSSSGYLGISAGWNAQIKDEQEYGVYLQGGGFSNGTLMNAYGALHLTDKATAISVDTAFSALFNIYDAFSLFMQTGLHKTNVNSTALKDEALKNMFAFIEPRVHLRYVNLDFTFFTSKISNRNHIFPTAPLLQSFSKGTDELYGGLNIFLGIGSMEIDKMQGGTHFLIAANTKKIKDVSAMAIAATPYFTVDIGPCDLDFRVTIYPLAYATPLSMFEGKIALKRTL